MALKTQSLSEREHTKRFQMQLESQEKQKEMEVEQEKARVEAERQLNEKKMQIAEINNKRNLRINAIDFALRGWGRWIRMKALMKRVKQIEDYLNTDQ